MIKLIYFVFISVQLFAYDFDIVLDRDTEICDVKYPKETKIKEVKDKSGKTIRVFFEKKNDPYVSVNGFLARKGQVECRSSKVLYFARDYEDKGLKFPAECRVSLDRDGSFKEIYCEEDSIISYKNIFYRKSLVFEKDYFEYPSGGRLAVPTEVFNVTWPSETLITTGKFVEKLTFEINSDFKFKGINYKPGSRLYFKKDGTFIQALNPEDEY